MTKAVSKTLSRNDLGDTGGHQAGILIPKDPRILHFFPVLDRNTKNPRQLLTMRERYSGERWQFAYIYYNNRLFGGTRNEYRLTHMTRFLRSVNAGPGDTLAFSRDDDWSYLIELQRPNSIAPPHTPVAPPDVLVLSKGWKIIHY